MTLNSKENNFPKTAALTIDPMYICLVIKRKLPLTAVTLKFHSGLPISVHKKIFILLHIVKLNGFPFSISMYSTLLYPRISSSQFLWLGLICLSMVFKQICLWKPYFIIYHKYILIQKHKETITIRKYILC